MKKLEVTKIVYSAETETTTISYHRFNTENGDNNSEGTWEVPGTLSNDEAVNYAKTMVEAGEEIEVSLNLGE